MFYVTTLLPQQNVNYFQINSYDPVMLLWRNFSDTTFTAQQCSLVSLSGRVGNLQICCHYAGVQTKDFVAAFDKQMPLIWLVFW